VKVRNSEFAKSKKCQNSASARPAKDQHSRSYRLVKRGNLEYARVMKGPLHRRKVNNAIRYSI